MSSVVKFIVGLGMSCVAGLAGARDLRVLAIGDMASLGCAEQVVATSVTPPACEGKGAWTEFAHQLQQRGLAQHVTVVTVDMESAPLENWVHNAAMRQKLDKVLQPARRDTMYFDYILVQSGVTAVDVDSVRHFNALRMLVGHVNSINKRGIWVFSRSANCPNKASLASIDYALSLYGRQPLSNRFLGPDLDRLPPGAIGADCMLTNAGQRQAGVLWADAVVKAASDSEKYRKEALIYYFE